MKGIIIALITICGLQIANAKEEVILTTTNHCVLYGDIDEKLINDTIRCLSHQKWRIKHKRPVYLVINSGGGYIDDGNKLIKYLKRKSIITITQFAGSMALAIVQGNPGKRIISTNGRIMQHRISSGIQHQFFDYQLFLAEVEESKRLSDNFHNIQLRRTNLNREFYFNKVNKEWRMNADEAIDYNFMDEKLVVKCSKKLNTKRKIQYEHEFFNLLTMYRHRCPLNYGYFK